MNSIGGQWIGRYTGANAGTFVVDLDRIGDRYEGTAVAWDDVQQSLNALVRLGFPAGQNTHSLQAIPIVLIDNLGNWGTPQFIKHQQETLGITYPSTVDISLSFSDDKLGIEWTTSIGSSAKGTADIPKTRLSLQSTITSKRLRTWASFKEKVTSLEAKSFVFRGQEDSRWRLRSSFFRTGRANLERFLNTDVSDLQKAFSSVSNHVFNLADPLHYGAFLNLAQHHGYPTPLLDWTWSPYVAAFFAFHRLAKSPVGRKGGYVRIYKFDIAKWQGLKRADKIFPIWPNVSILDALAFGNPRAVPQQAISTVSNVDDIEAYIESVESREGHKYIEAFDLPTSERDIVMRELALMGITAGSLFPGLDGVCESLKERNF
jgi:FRG domain